MTEARRERKRTLESILSRLKRKIRQKTEEQTSRKRERENSTASLGSSRETEASQALDSHSVALSSTFPTTRSPHSLGSERREEEEKEAPFLGSWHGYPSQPRLPVHPITPRLSPCARREFSPTRQKPWKWRGGGKRGRTDCAERPGSRRRGREEAGLVSQPKSGRGQSMGGGAVGVIEPPLRPSLLLSLPLSLS